MLSLFVIMGILMAGTIPGQQLVFADSDELEVKIKIKNGVAEVEVEFEDDEYEFQLATSNIDEILEITSLRTGISLDLLEGAMKLEVKDEHDDKSNEDDERDDKNDLKDIKTETSEKKLRASIFGDSSEVKIELKFITDTTDSILLIDEILANFMVTQEEAEDALKIQEDDDELEEKFKVEIEIKDGISEVEVELRYVLDSTNRDEIISSIVEQSHLDIDILVDAMNVQVESDGDSSDSGDLDNSELESDGDSSDSGDLDNSELEELREENQLLREENNNLRGQLANLNNVLMEQIRVIMDTLAALRS